MKRALIWLLILALLPLTVYAEGAVCVTASWSAQTEAVETWLEDLGADERMASVIAAPAADLMGVLTLEGIFQEDHIRTRILLKEDPVVTAESQRMDEGTIAFQTSFFPDLTLTQESFAAKAEADPSTIDASQLLETCTDLVSRWAEGLAHTE